MYIQGEFDISNLKYYPTDFSAIEETGNLYILQY